MHRSRRRKNKLQEGFLQPPASALLVSPKGDCRSERQKGQEGGDGVSFSHEFLEGREGGARLRLGLALMGRCQG
jgi:hypothetical protein